MKKNVLMGVIVGVLIVGLGVYVISEDKNTSVEYTEDKIITGEMVSVSTEGKKTKENSGFVGIVNDNNVRVRREPLLKENIVGELDKGEEVVLRGKSVFSQTIGKMNSRWIEIAWEEGSGWVYGYFVDMGEGDESELPVKVDMSLVAHMPKEYVTAEDIYTIKNMSIEDANEYMKGFVGKIFDKDKIKEEAKEKGYILWDGSGGGGLVQNEAGVYSHAADIPLFEDKQLVMLEQTVEINPEEVNYLYYIVDYYIWEENERELLWSSSDSYGAIVEINEKKQRGFYGFVITERVFADEDCYVNKIFDLYKYNTVKGKIERVDIDLDTVRILDDSCDSGLYNH